MIFFYESKISIVADGYLKLTSGFPHNNKVLLIPNNDECN